MASAGDGTGRYPPAITETATTPGASALERAILDRGRVEGPLVKVDDFLNHRVDPRLLRLIGDDIAQRWTDHDVELVLTAEASGIPPALATAEALGVEMIYAKKYPRAVSERPAYVREVASPTKGAAYRVEVARRQLEAGTRVLIVDDFLSGGRTALALGEIAEEADAIVLGFGFVIEKSFVDGRAALTERGWSVDSLVRVTNIEPALDIDASRLRIGQPEQHR